MESLLDFEFDDGFVIVVGSAGVDIKARPHSPPIEESANPGYVRNSAGGVARNIAENLARLEVSTVLLTAVGNDDEGDRVVRVSSEAGVHCDFIRKVDNARTSSYVALMRENGDLHTAITDSDISKYVDSDYIQQHDMLFSTASMVVVDATLSAEALETVFEIASHYDLRVCADPTNPQFAAKLRPYISQMYLIVPNAAETEALCGETVKINGTVDPTQATRVAKELVKLGAEISVVTLGGHGMAYAHVNGSGFIRAAQVEVIDPTGAGDAFSAAVIFGLLNEVALDEVMRLGATAAALTLSTRETVCADITQERLYDTLVV